VNERKKNDRFAFDRDRWLAVAARFLLRQVLSEYHRVPPDAWEFATTEFGKPHLVGPMSHPELCFNVTHADGLLAVAVTQGRAVGVDAEPLDREVDWESIADHFFAKNELTWLQQQPTSEQRGAFLRLWTLKESFLKAVGTGLSRPLDSFWFEMRADGTPALRFTVGSEDAWEVTTLDGFPGHQLAVTVAATTGSTIKMFDGTSKLILTH